MWHIRGAKGRLTVSESPDDKTPKDSAPATSTGLGKQSKLILAAVIVLALVALLWPRGKPAEKDPASFLLDDHARATTLAAHLAPVTLVHFWASWCAPCVTEVPSIERLASDFSNHPDFRVLMVAVADQVGQVRTFLGEQDAQTVLFDPNWRVAHRFGTEKLPETYLMVDGKSVKKFIGATNWDSPVIRAEIRHYLKTPAMPASPPPVAASGSAKSKQP